VRADYIGVFQHLKRRIAAPVRWHAAPAFASRKRPNL